MNPHSLHSRSLFLSEESAEAALAGDQSLDWPFEVVADRMAELVVKLLSPPGGQKCHLQFSWALIFWGALA